MAKMTVDSGALNRTKIDELIAALEAWKDAGYGFPVNKGWRAIREAIVFFLKDRTETSAVLTYRTYQYVLRDEKREVLMMGTAEQVANGLLSKGGS